MNLKDYLLELYDYNYWANKRYLAVAETLDKEQLFRKQGHSWDSVQAVLVHMMSSERMWSQRWQGEKGTFLDPKDFPSGAAIREACCGAPARSWWSRTCSTSARTWAGWRRRPSW